MKDRWKIFIVSLVFGLIFAMFLFFLGFSFKTVGLNDFALLQYTFFKTVDRSQSVRSSGNYLVGIDYGFISYPRGILKHQFKIDILTKDKSILNIEGLFLGQLIESQIINLHFNYGPDDYFTIVSRYAQEVFRESIEQFLLRQIISDRANINNYVSSNVCLNVQSKYSFIKCKYASTGAIQIQAKPAVLQVQTSIQEYYILTLQKVIAAQKQLNVYQNGGYDSIDIIEQSNALLFKNTTQLITSTVGDYTNDTSEYFAAAMYLFDNPLMPILDNSIKVGL